MKNSYIIKLPPNAKLSLSGMKEPIEKYSPISNSNFCTNKPIIQLPPDKIINILAKHCFPQSTTHGFDQTMKVTSAGRGRTIMHIIPRITGPLFCPPGSLAEGY